MNEYVCHILPHEKCLIYGSAFDKIESGLKTLQLVNI